MVYEVTADGASTVIVPEVLPGKIRAPIRPLPEIQKFEVGWAEVLWFQIGGLALLFGGALTGSVQTWARTVLMQTPEIAAKTTRAALKRKIDDLLFMVLAIGFGLVNKPFR